MHFAIQESDGLDHGRNTPFRRTASVGGYFVRVPVSWHLHRDVGLDLLCGGTSSA